MSRRLRLVLLVGMLALAAVAPGSAVAATSIDVALIGTFTAPGGETGSVGGVISVTRFDATAGGIEASGAATVSLCIPGVDPKNCLATISFPVAVDVASVAATCTSVDLELAAFSVVDPPSLAGFTFTFDATPLVLDPNTDAADRIACSLARRLDRDLRDSSLARLLNRLLASLA